MLTNKSQKNILHDMTRTRQERDMTRTYSQMHRTEKYSEHSSIIWPVWPNGWVFVYELSGSGFESSRSHLNFRFRSECQGVPWHPGNYRVLIHSETRTWNDKIIQPSIMFPSFLFLYFFGWYECTILWIS